jgi:membrane dipeptidase
LTAKDRRLSGEVVAMKLDGIDGSATEETARYLHTQSLVVDAHVDTLLKVVADGRGLGERSPERHVDLPRLLEGGVKVQFFACYIEPAFKPDRGLQRVIQMIDIFHAEATRNADTMSVCTDTASIHAAVENGRLAAILTVEGGEAIGADLAALRMLHRLGVRSMGLVWNQRNLIADGVGERRTRGGLTTFGVEVVREMNRLGMIVDVSHLTDEGFYDVIETSRAPIMATHSNARAVCDHPRNLTDDQIRTLAVNGGVMGINFAPAFVRKEDANVEAVLDHVDHVVGLVGPDHVGLGSDFDGIGPPPRGLSDPTCLWRLTEGLMKRGYAADDIRKVLGGNHLRVIRCVMG